MTLKDQIVLVTGASRGFGMAIAEEDVAVRSTRASAWTGSRCYG